MKKVKDIFTPDLTAVSENTTLRETARILARHRLTGVAVVDEKGKVIGFISEADLVHSAFPSRFGTADDFLVHNFVHLAREMSQVGEKLVKDFMTEEVVYLTEDQTLAEAAELILGRGLKIVPVLREDKLIGWLERGKLCEALMKEGE